MIEDRIAKYQENKSRTNQLEAIPRANRKRRFEEAIKIWLGQSTLSDLGITAVDAQVDPPDYYITLNYRTAIGQLRGNEREANIFMTYGGKTRYLEMPMVGNLPVPVSDVVLGEFFDRIKNA